MKNKKELVPGVEKKKPIEHWNNMIRHINTTWQAKKKVDFGYPFVGKDFRQLTNAVRHFKVWGVKALWDEYLMSDDEWARKTGYSISGFAGCLVWLVDKPHWKAASKRYEEELMPPIEQIMGKIEQEAGAEIIKEQHEKGG